jgi:hypothetical protein
VFSAYRPPAFGIGAFSDKFNSLHSYGLAVDVHGIGRPGSPEAQLWHEIAARNGVICPYGPHDRAEWNHCQPSSVKIILPENSLRETISAAGPVDLERMFEAGTPIIESVASAAESLSRAAPTPVRELPFANWKVLPIMQSQLRGLLLVGSQSDIRVPPWCGSGPNQAPARSWGSAQDGRLLSRRAAGRHIRGGANPCRGRDAAQGSHQSASSRRRWFPGGLGPHTPLAVTSKPLSRNSRQQGFQLSSTSHQSGVTLRQP